MRAWPMIVVALVVFAGGQAAAQAQPQDCSQAASNVEMGECLQRELKREDAALNRIYQEALRSTRDNDSMPAAERRKWEAAVRDSQRKWIAFRDADCKALPFFEFYGGSGVGVASLSCLVEKTKTRTRDLTERYAPR